MKATDPAAQKRAFDLIWSQMPHMQKRTSSSWWFFILFPRGPEGYGPRQLMYAIATRAGRLIRVNGVWLPVIDLKRPIQDGLDRFSAINTAWLYDGDRLYKHLVRHPAGVTLRREGAVEAWTQGEDGERYGGQINAGTSRPLSLQAHFRGPGGEGRFDFWGDLNSVNTSPFESISVDTPLGGIHYIPWRMAHFEGDFRWPAGQERLSGLGFFQRVSFNVPLFPWKWVWAVFEDGTFFSAYVSYLGLNLLRKGYGPFRREWMERYTLSLVRNAFWDWAGAGEMLRFDTATVTPKLGRGPHLHFDLEARSPNGNHVRFRAEPYERARSWIDRPMLGGLLESHWSYNEFLFRIRALEGNIGGRRVDRATMGNGFGTLEYTYGLGL
jgi:hypothetical protein